MNNKKLKFLLAKLLLIRKIKELERLGLLKARIKDKKQDEFDINHPNTIIEEYEYPTNDYLEDLNKSL